MGMDSFTSRCFCTATAREGRRTYFSSNFLRELSLNFLPSSLYIPIRPSFLRSRVAACLRALSSPDLAALLRCCPVLAFAAVSCLTRLSYLCSWNLSV